MFRFRSPAVFIAGLLSLPVTTLAAGSEGVPFVGLDDGGRSQVIGADDRAQRDRLGRIMDATGAAVIAAIEGSATAAPLATPSRAHGRWRLRTVTVGIGGDLDANIFGKTLIGAHPRIRLIFSNLVNGEIPD